MQATFSDPLGAYPVHVEGHFRVDPGETEPGGTLTVAASAVSPPTEPAAPPPAEVAARRPERWGPGRVTRLVAASILGLISLGLVGAGGTGIVFDQTQRDSSGYLMTPTERYSTSTYALVSASYRGGTSGDWFVNRDLVGTVKLRASSTRRVFIGIGPEQAVNSYLAGVAHARGDSFTTSSADFRTYSGGAPATPPTAERFWAVRATGSGQQTLTWNPQPGNWRIVLMNAYGSAGVSSEVSVGARVPHLLAISIGAVGVGLVLLLISGIGIYFAARPRGS